MHIILDKDPSGTMMSPPFESMPWLRMYTILPICLVLWIVGATIYESIRYEKGSRWWNKINNIKAINVVMKRDISNDEHFSNLEKNKFFEEKLYLNVLWEFCLIQNPPNLNLIHPKF